MPTGEALRERWQCILVGIGHLSGEFILINDGNERDLLKRVSEYLSGIDTIYYAAGFRDFDEMVLKGRFTNARRAHLPKPGPWPHLKDADKYTWINLKGVACADPERYTDDIRSQDVPALWQEGKRDKVLKHLRYDLEDLRKAVG
jgi:hypothetical protein